MSNIVIIVLYCRTNYRLLIFSFFFFNWKDLLCYCKILITVLGLCFIYCWICISYNFCILFMRHPMHFSAMFLWLLGFNYIIFHNVLKLNFKLLQIMQTVEMVVDNVPAQANAASSWVICELTELYIKRNSTITVEQEKVYEALFKCSIKTGSVVLFTTVMYQTLIAWCR